MKLVILICLIAFSGCQTDCCKELHQVYDEQIEEFKGCKERSCGWSYDDIEPRLPEVCRRNYSYDDGPCEKEKL